MIMRFSRTRPSVDMLAAMLKQGAPGEAAPATAKRSVRLLDTSAADNAAVMAAQPVIQDMKDVPDGRYQSFADLGIPASFDHSFAILRNGDTAAVLLIAEEAAGSHPQFELQRRLQAEHGIATVKVRRASREIIKCVHDANESAQSTENTQVEDAAWAIVEEALAKGASDIHFETRGSFAKLYFRVHGERVEQPSIAAKTATEICNVLYGVHADGDNKDVSWDTKTVKDTVIPYTTIDGRDVQLRFSSAPIHPSGNFHAVVRLLVMDASTIRPIDQIGYTAAQEEAIDEMLLGAQGMVILAGVTNSGKSTSMQSFIERIYQIRGRSIKVITVEDPVEYVIPDACQSGVSDGRRRQDEHSGSRFTDFLRGILRQDPDVAMVGEIRDNESAEHVKHLVLAGRKLLTTLHVNDVYAVFPRLREIGIPESVLYMEGFVSGVICQRLVPCLCPECSIPVTEAVQTGRIRSTTYDRVCRVSDVADDNVRVRGDGCRHCHGMGIVGRTPCAEILIPDATFLGLMAQGRLNDARKHWVSNAKDLNIGTMGVSMIAHAIQKMRMGLLDPTHVESQVGRLVLDPMLGAPEIGTTNLGTDYPPSLR